MKKKFNKPLKVILITLGVIVLLAASYVIYVFASYDRLPDNIEIKIQKTTGEPDSKVAGDASIPVPVDEEFLITSYNVGFGAYSDDYTFFMDGGKESWARSAEAATSNINNAALVITGKTPDIALFQEVDFDSTRAYHIDERELIATAMGKINQYAYTFAQNYDSPFLMYPLTQPHGANKSGLMTFSSFGMQSALRRSLPIETGLSKVLDLDRCYCKNRIKANGGKELVVYNVHLSAYTSDPMTAQTQLQMLLEDMRGEYKAGNYCIAGGDFNSDLLGDSPSIFHTESVSDNWAKPINMELFGEGAVLVAPFGENTKTGSARNNDVPYKVGNFVVLVDGFIVTDNIKVTETDVIDTGFKFSDHNPVYAKFKLISQ